MNQKCNDLGNVFLFRGKKTGFNFVVPLLLFTNYENVFATVWRGSDRAVALSQPQARGDQVCVKHTPLGGAAKPHQIQCLSARSPHIKHHPVLHQEETGLNVWCDKPAAKFIITFLLFHSQAFGDSCQAPGPSGLLWQ